MKVEWFGTMFSETDFMFKFCNVQLHYMRLPYLLGKSHVSRFQHFQAPPCLAGRRGVCILSLPDWCFNLGVSQGLSSSHLRGSYWKLLFWVKGKNIFRTYFLKHSKTIRVYQNQHRQPTEASSQIPNMICPIRFCPLQSICIHVFAGYIKVV